MTGDKPETVPSLLRVPGPAGLLWLLQSEEIAMLDDLDLPRRAVSAASP